MTGWGGAADGLLAALTAGVFSLLLRWLGRRNPDRVALSEAWKNQAEALRNELRSVYEDRDADKDQQIEYLQGQNRVQAVELSRKASEIRRLNKLLNTRGGDD